MCGVVAYSVSETSGLKVEFLNAAVAELRHRGPDDSGVFVDTENGIGLGHARLSILDLSQLGHQPMVSDGGEVALVFNGEIYNFRELRAELEELGRTFKSNSDTEVLLQLYLTEGDSMLSRLNGVFALALWDARRGSTLLARDALGVKPLYYFARHGVFACASEIKALSVFLPEPRYLDAAALDRYLSFLWCPGDQTLLSDVRKLGPGEALWVSNGKIEHSWAWYQLPAFAARPNHLSLRMRKGEAIAGTLKHLRYAVQRQMMADVPVGAFLSGGLDSSAVVALAREQNPDIRCFTIDTAEGGDSGFTDDLPYARQVAKHLGVSLDVVQIDAARIADDLERMVTQLDEPLADLAALNVFYISQFARKQGIKVLLSGAGGDDLFTGYRRHRALMAEGWWSWLPQPARVALACATAKLDQRNALSRRLTKLFSGAALCGDARLVNYFRWAGRADLERLYSAEFRVALGDSLAETPMLDFLKILPEGTHRLERLLALEQRFFLADHNLLYTDKMSMAVGVEVRVPFLDLELIEFVSRIHPQLKQRGSEGKWVLKKAMESHLPLGVIYRPKAGFGVPLRRWMRYELREMLRDWLSETSIRQRGLFDPIAVQKMIADNDAGRVDASYTLLSLLCIEIWCRKFIDSNPKFDELKKHETNSPIT